MPEQFSPLTLENIDGGSVPEVFNAELRKVLDNINDPNTSPKAKRRIRLDVTFVPGEDLSKMVYLVQCSATLAPVRASANQAHLVRQGGQLHALTENVKQDDLLAAVPAPERSSVTPIAGAGAR